MGRIISVLKGKGVNFSKIDALEFFARDGSWQTIRYSNKVKSLTAWEIDHQYESELRKNLPNAIIEIENSFLLTKKKKYENLFDFIVFDNPQMIYGDYCEHFECLELLPLLIKKEGGIVVFNINHSPFDYDSKSLWGLRRKKYYDKDASNLKIEFLLKFYEDKFSDLGFDTNFSFEEKRNDEYLSYLVYKLTPISIK